MTDPALIDSHVHVGRSHARWPEVRPLLEAAGIDTAVLAADPGSHDLDSDAHLPGDLSRTGGPYALWYVGGNPFGGMHRAPPRLPRELDDFQGVEWHCHFSDRYDYGGSSDELAATAATALLDSSAGQAALDILGAFIGAGLPIRLTESLPVTLALIERWPQAVFIVPHMGSRNGGVSRCLNALKGNPQVHFDTSAVQLNEGMVETVGFQRVLLGSDAPEGDPALAVRQVRGLDLPPEQVAAILGPNARRLFEPDARL